MTKSRSMLALIAVLVFALVADAGPFRRGGGGRRGGGECSSCGGGSYTTCQPATTSPAPIQVQPKEVIPGPKDAPKLKGKEEESEASATSGDAFEEVNTARARRGLRPFVRDEGLARAALGAATFRAERGIQGHTGNDFAALPSGTSATSAGCAAWPPHMGWGSCCWEENHTYAGAAWALGRGGLRYMHIFVR